MPSNEPTASAEEMERQIVERCECALAEAFRSARTAGHPVMIAGQLPDGSRVLLEESPEGGIRLVKRSTPPYRCRAARGCGSAEVAAPCVRVFAGPNGSGKSTMCAALDPEWLGTFVNADEIEGSIRRTGQLDLGTFQIEASADELSRFFGQHALAGRAGLRSGAVGLYFPRSRLTVEAGEVNSYLASIAADFIRRRLLESGRPFTFETVMSSPDKVEFMRQARREGRCTCLYYVATEDPEINVSRVRARAANGGHTVPADKIVSRYRRSLDALPEAIRAVDRSYVFDNSTRDTEPKLIARVIGEELEILLDPVPGWFHQAVWRQPGR